MLAAQAATKKHLQLKEAYPPSVFVGGGGASHNNSNSQQ
jgi:hypothetical protein